MKIYETRDLEGLGKQLEQLDPTSPGYNADALKAIRTKFPDMTIEQEMAMLDEIKDSSTGMPVQEFFIKLAEELDKGWRK